jgi:hypothetical protein
MSLNNLSNNSPSIYLLNIYGITNDKNIINRKINIFAEGGLILDGNLNIGNIKIFNDKICINNNCLDENIIKKIIKYYSNEYKSYDENILSFNNINNLDYNLLSNNDRIYTKTDNINIFGQYIYLYIQNISCLYLDKVEIYDSDNNLIDNKSITITKSSNFNLSNLSTSCKDQPWILLDLKKSITITKIIIYNRSDCCFDDINGLIINVMDKNKKIIYTAEPIIYMNPNDVYLYILPNTKLLYINKNIINDKIKLN